MNELKYNKTSNIYTDNQPLKNHKLKTMKNTTFYNNLHRNMLIINREVFVVLYFTTFHNYSSSNGNF